MDFPQQPGGNMQFNGGNNPPQQQQQHQPQGWQASVTYDERKRLIFILVGVIKNLGAYPHDKMVALAKQYENFIFNSASSKADYLAQCRNKMKSIQETVDQQRQSQQQQQQAGAPSSGPGAGGGQQSQFDSSSMMQQGNFGSIPGSNSQYMGGGGQQQDMSAGGYQQSPQNNAIFQNMPRDQQIRYMQMQKAAYNQRQQQQQQQQQHQQQQQQQQQQPQQQQQQPQPPPQAPPQPQPTPAAGGSQQPIQGPDKTDIMNAAIPPTLLAKIPDLPPGVQTWGQISELLKSGGLPRNSMSIIKHVHQMHTQWLAQQKKHQQQQQTTATGPNSQQPQQKYPQQQQPQGGQMNTFQAQPQQPQVNYNSAANNQQDLRARYLQQQQAAAAAAAANKPQPQQQQQKPATQQYAGYPQQQQQQQWDANRRPQPQQQQQAPQQQMFGQQNQQQGQFNQFQSAPVRSDPQQVPAGQQTQGPQQGRPNAMGMPPLSESDKERLRQVFDEAAKIPIRLQDFTNELSPEEKRYVTEQIQSMQLMYQRIDQLVPMFFLITRNTQATCRLLQMKSMFKQQMENLGKGKFLTNPQILDKTKYEINRYFMFVKENLQNHQRAAQQSQQPQQQQQQQQQQAPQPTTTSQFQPQAQPATTQGPQTFQQHQQQPYQPYRQQPQAQQQPQSQMFMSQGYTMEPQGGANVVNMNEQQFQQPGYNQGPQRAGGQQQTQGGPMMQVPAFVHQQPQQTTAAYRMQQQQQQQKAQNNDTNAATAAAARGRKNTPKTSTPTAQKGTPQPPAAQMIPQQPPMSQAQAVPGTTVATGGPNMAMNAATSGNNGQQQAQFTQTPSVVPAYGTQGISADQLKLPANRKRKSTSASNNNTPSATASPEDSRVVSPANNSKAPPAKREKLDHNEKLRQKALLDYMQKKKELAKTQPLAYFITSLGEALDISEEEVTNAINKANGDNKSAATNGSGPTPGQLLNNINAASKSNNVNSGGNGGGVTPTALLRTPQPFAAKTPAANNKLVSVPEDDVSANGKTTLPPTPPWSGNVQAVAIRNAFQAIDCVKTADIQFLTPPEEHKTIPHKKNDDNSDKKNANSKTEDPVMPVSNPETGEIMKLQGLENANDINLWDYDEVMNAIGKDPEELKKDFWTLS